MVELTDILIDRPDPSLISNRLERGRGARIGPYRVPYKRLGY